MGSCFAKNQANTDSSESIGRVYESRSTVEQMRQIFES